MKKKTAYCSVELNEEATLERYPHLTWQEIREWSDKFDKDNFLFLRDLHLLRGKNGEVAKVRTEPVVQDTNPKHSLEKDEAVLLIEYPLKLHIKNRVIQKWISYAHKYFKPLLTKQVESVQLNTEGAFSEITKKPYSTIIMRGRGGKPTCEIRTKSYADRNEYRSSKQAKSRFANRER